MKKNSPIITDYASSDKSEVTLREIIGNEAKSDQKQPPKDAVLNQIQWKMSNKKFSQYSSAC